MECSSDVVTSCGILKNFQTTDSIFGWTNKYINTLCVMGYLHSKQTFHYYSYDQRNKSSAVQINIFFYTGHFRRKDLSTEEQSVWQGKIDKLTKIWTNNKTNTFYNYYYY